MITFNRVTFVNDNDNVPVDADNLNNIETALKTVCDGGASSGLDADRVRGKNIAEPVRLSKGLIGHWDLSCEEFPDKVSGQTYFKKEWTDTDSWASENSTATIGYSNNHLTVAPSSGSTLTFNKTITGIASKTLKIKIKNTGDFDANGGLMYYGASGYLPLTLVPYYDYYIGTVQTDATTADILKFRLFLNTSATSAVQYIQWIYVGTGEYSSDIQDSFGYLPGTLYGPTTTRDGERARSLYFDGVNDRALLTIPSLSKATALSLVIRLSSQSTVDVRTPLVLGQGSSVGGITISAASGSNNFNIEFHRSGDNEILSSAFSLSSATTSVIVLTYSAKAWVLYKDGLKVTNGTLANELVFPTGTCELGSRNSTQYFKGLISAFTLYDRVLSEEEVWEIQQRPYFLDSNSYNSPILKPNTPATITSPGRPGQIVYDSGYLYVCIAANTWRRTALATW